MTTQPLKSCPCGQVPRNLVTGRSGACVGWVVADCCRKWKVFFSCERGAKFDPVNKSRAEEAWNAAPRAEESE